MSKSRTLSSIFALGIGLSGCTGLVAGTDNGGTSNGASTSNGATPSTGGGSGSTGGIVDGAAPDPGVAAMHRLNTAEYNATVTDVLGTTMQPANANWSGGEIDGFDNIASTLSVDDAQYNLYVDAAEGIATDVFASPTLRAKIVTCTTADDMTCVKSVISKTGLKVFRRPLADAEVTTYSKVYTASRAQGQDHNGALQDVLWSFLSSAEFLYRMEFDGGVQTKHLITGYELASRLSYFLWSSAPDDALLAAADSLNADVAINTTVERMIADGKSGRLVQNFAGQWLGARKTLAHPVAPDIYPVWNADIATAASNEIYSYFDEFLRKERPWTDFLTADLNFVTPALAGLYGITGVSGTTAQRVENFAGDNRAGFMSLVGFLAVSSVDRRSSPTLRGKWLLVNLMCSPPPPPPPGVKPLENTGPTDTTDVRAVLEAHRAAPACAACHSVMDPFGLALEKYDGIGRYRATYANGSAINDATSLPKTSAYPNGVSFQGLAGAAKAVGDNPMFKECVAEKLYTYGLGRSLTDSDKANTAAIEKGWEASGGLTLNHLLHSLALAEAFRYRNPAAH